MINNLQQNKLHLDRSVKPASSKHKERLPGLDGLRGLAALSVFYVHFNQIVQLDAQIGAFSLYRLLANGNHAVSLFFSLSGFLLSMPFWKAIVFNESFPSVRVYLLRRVFRILPAYYLALTILVLLSGLWRLPGAWTDLLLHYTFLFNYTEFSIFSINAPFWTLAVEFQFYLLLPLLFFIIRHLPGHGRYAVWQMVLLGVGAYVLHRWLSGSVSSMVAWPFNPQLTWIRPHGAVLYHSLLANLPHFLIGVVLARWFLAFYRSHWTDKRQVYVVCDITFWFCLLSILILLGTDWSESISLSRGPYSLPVVPLFLGALIFTAPISRVARRILESFPIRGLGLVSYGFYVYHLPCLNLLDRTMMKSGLEAAEHWILLGCVGMLCTLVLAILSFYLIEKPCLKLIARR